MISFYVHVKFYKVFLFEPNFPTILPVQSHFAVQPLSEEDRHKSNQPSTDFQENQPMASRRNEGLSSTVPEKAPRKHLLPICPLRAGAPIQGGCARRGGRPPSTWGCMGAGCHHTTSLLPWCQCTVQSVDFWLAPEHQVLSISSWFYVYSNEGKQSATKDLSKRCCHCLLTCQQWKKSL